MEHIIKLIEGKFASDECTIYVLKHEIEELKSKLAKAQEKIAEQAEIINDMRREGE